MRRGTGRTRRELFGSISKAGALSNRIPYPANGHGESWVPKAVDEFLHLQRTIVPRGYGHRALTSRAFCLAPI